MNRDLHSEFPSQDALSEQITEPADAIAASGRGQPDHRTRFQGLLAISLLAGVAVLGWQTIDRSRSIAFGGFHAVSRPAATAPAALAPADEDTDEEPAGPVTRILKVARGDTLANLLYEAGATRDEATRALKSLAQVFNMRQLRVGQEITATFRPNEDGDNALEKLTIKTDVDRTAIVERDQVGDYGVNEHVIPLSRTPLRVDVTISGSLYESAARAGLPPQLIGQLIKLFSYDVDFQRDIHEGDRFQVYFERYQDKSGQAWRDGDILYASIHLDDGDVEIYRYRDADGHVEYYDEDGDPIRKALLRTPIDGARITSGFGMRMHPLLGYTKMHKGLDFGAPVGTPIMAAGDGLVELAGFNGSYGNYVRLKHNGQYETAYAHMSRLAVRNGQRVHQGDVIGYVGTTGRSTGPHLHYELLQGGAQINPRGVAMMNIPRLAGRALTDFTRTVQQVNAEMTVLPPETRIASAQP